MSSTLDDEEERQADDVKQTAANLNRQEIEDIKWLMSSPRGRRLVWWILGIAGIYRTSFSSSRNVTDFNEGGRNIGLKLLARVNDHCLDQYEVMFQEHQEKRKK